APIPISPMMRASHTARVICRLRPAIEGAKIGEASIHGKSTSADDRHATGSLADNFVRDPGRQRAVGVRSRRLAIRYKGLDEVLLGVVVRHDDIVLVVGRFGFSTCIRHDRTLLAGMRRLRKRALGYDSLTYRHCPKRPRARSASMLVMPQPAIE